MVSRVLTALTVLMLAAQLALAQQPPICSVSGVAYQADGTPDANDTITIVPNPSTQVVNGVAITAQPKSVTTDSSGNVTPFAMVQGLTVNVSFHNSTAAPRTTFVPNSSGASFGNFISASSISIPVSFCAAPVGFGQLPSDPTIGATCPILDAPVCQLGTPVTIGGGTTFCTLTWVGSNWFPGGNAIAPGQNPSATPTPFTLTGSVDFHNFSGLNANQLQLVRLSPPGSVSVTPSCSGSCSTEYTYEVSCVGDQGETTTTQVRGDNVATLSSTNHNLVGWTPEQGCYGGYNVYGRTAGSLGLLATVPQDTTTYNDDGSAVGGESYAWKWSSAAYPAVVVYDLQNALAKGTGTSVLNVAATILSGNSTTPAVTGYTSTVNNVLDMAIFETSPAAGTFSAPSGGFTSALQLLGTANVNYGLWSGVRTLAAAGAAARVNGTTPNTGAWRSIRLPILSVDPSTAITVRDTLSTIGGAPYTNLTFGNPPATVAGDLLVACVSYLAGPNMTAPSAATWGQLVTNLPTTGQLAMSCYSHYAEGSKAPPTLNTTGSIVQQKTNGDVWSIREAGLETWTAHSESLNAAQNVIASSVAYPTDMHAIGCRTSWHGLACSTTFPVLALKDTTTGVTVCSSGTTSTANTDKAVTPASYIIAANDVLALTSTTAGAGCTTGAVSMTITMHQ